MPLTNPAIASISAGAAVAVGPEVVFADSPTVSFGAAGSTVTAHVAAAAASLTVGSALQDVGTATKSGTDTSRFAADDHVHRGVLAVDVNGIASSFYGQVDFSAGNLMTLSTGGATTAGSIVIHNVLSSSNIAQPVSSVSNAGALVSRFALADHAHAGVNSVSANGNTAGNVTGGAGSLVLAGGPNITLSGATAAGGMTLSISGPATTLVPVVSNAIQDVATATRSGTNTSRFAADDHAHRGVLAVDVNGIASSFYGQVDLSAGNLMTLSTAGNSTAGSIAFHNLLSSSAIANPVSSASAAGTLSSRFALADHAHAGINSVSVAGNTSGTTTAGAGSLVLAGGPNITLSAATAAGGMTVSVSGPATTLVPVVSNAIQDVATATRSGTNTSRFAADDHAHRGVLAVDVNGIASSFYGQVDLSAGNLMTLSTAGNSTAGSIAFHNLLSSSAIANPVSSASAAGTLSSRFALADHAHAGINSVSVVGNTAGTTTAGAGSLVLAGGPNITLSASTAAGGMTVSVSAGAAGGAVVSNAIQDVATATRSGTNTSRFAADDHAHRGVLAVDVNGIASSFYGQVDLSAGNLMTLSTAGNSTAGSIAFHNLLSSSAIANPVSSASAAGTLSSRFALADHAHAGIMSVSAAGNTVGNTSAGAGSLVIAGGLNATLSGATAAGGMTLSIVGPSAGTGDVIAAGGSTANSTGTVLFNNLNGISFGFQTGASSTNITASHDALRSISAGTSSGSYTGITLSDSNNIVFGNNLGTITASANPPTLQFFDNALPNNGTSSAVGTSHGTIQVYPLFHCYFPGNMTVKSVQMDFTFASNTNMTAARSYTVFFGLYTVSASSTLNLLYSASTALTNNATSNASASWHGLRWISLNSTLFNNNSLTLSQGEYYAAELVLSGGSTMGMSHLAYAPFGYAAGAGARFGTAGVSQAASLTAGGQHSPFYGLFSASSSVLPASIHVSGIANSRNYIPHFIFENRVSSF